MRLSTRVLQKRLKGQKGQKKYSIWSLPVGFAVILSWLAGASFTLSLAPYGFWPLAVLSPAVLYALLLGEMSQKRAFWVGEAYGMGLWCVGAFWLYTSIHDYGGVSSWLALLMIVGMGLCMGLFHAGLAVLFNRFLGKQPFAFASLWVVQEWLKTWVLTGFPWLFVGYAFTSQAWLSSLAPVFGVFAVSFVAVLLAASLVEVTRYRAGYLVASMVFVFLSILLWLINPAWTKPKNTPNLSVSLIQGNIPQDLKWLTTYRDETLQIYAKLTQSEWGRDLVVWPESSIPMFQTQAWGFITEIVRTAKLTKTTWITGVPYLDLQEYDPKVHKYYPFYNSVVALGTDAIGLYKKQRLVPFGEYTPFEGILNILPNLATIENLKQLQSFSRGSANQSPLHVRAHDVGVAICYEVAYPETTRKNALGTDFLLTVSNDAWFGTSAGPRQHLQMVQMRSIETGRWFIRATNTGVTAIIDHHGKIVAQAPQFERTVLRGEVQARTGKTPFMFWGQIPILTAVSILLLLSYLGQRAQRRAILGK